MRTRGSLAGALAAAFLISAALAACGDGGAAGVPQADSTAADMASNQAPANRFDSADDSDATPVAMSPGVQVSYGAAPALPQAALAASAASARPDFSMTASQDGTTLQSGPVLHFPRDSSGG